MTKGRPGVRLSGWLWEWETLALPPALFSREGGLGVWGARRGPHTQKEALLRGPQGLPDCLESWLLVKLKAREGRSSEKSGGGGCQSELFPLTIKVTGDFPGGPVAKTPCFPCRGPGFDP